MRRRFGNISFTALTLVAAACGNNERGAVDAGGNGPGAIIDGSVIGPGSGDAGTTGGTAIRVLQDGILLDAGHNANAPLTVQVVDAAGHPQANMPITWTMISGNSAFPNTFYCPASAMTDAMGVSTCEMVGVQISSGAPFETNVMRVHIDSGATVDLRAVVCKEYLPGSSSVLLSLLDPMSERLPNMHVGDTVTGALRIQVYSEISGQGIPDVGIHFTSTTSYDASTIVRCNDGFAYTNAMGIATCDAHALAPSATLFDVTIGDARGYPITAQVM